MMGTLSGALDWGIGDELPHLEAVEKQLHLEVVPETFSQPL